MRALWKQFPTKLPCGTAIGDSGATTKQERSMGRDYERNPVATMIQVEESYWLKVRHFLTWRDVLIDMTGSRLKTVLQDRPLPEARRFGKVESVGLWEAKRTDADRGVPVTPERRRGIWAETPEEPLWVLFYLTIPGGVLQARHIGPIAQRLEELDELVSAVSGYGHVG
jgi:hypothetical protein